MHANHRVIIIFPYCSFRNRPTWSRTKKMAQTFRVEYLKKDLMKLEPYYADEIIPYVVERNRNKPKGIGRLGASPTHLGMGKIRVKTSLGKYAVDFLNKATVHGLNHLVAPHRHFFERILTVLFIGAALGCLVATSLYSWYQYQHNPTAMVLQFDYQNFNITKPAITVCLDEAVAMEKFPKAFKKHGVADTPQARAFFLFISNPNYLTLNQTPMYTGTPSNKWMEIVRDLYFDLEPNKCNLANCQDTYLTDIVTERGMCTTLFGAYSNYSSLETVPVYQYIHRNDRINLKQIPRPYKMSLHHPRTLPTFKSWWSQFTKIEMIDMKISVKETDSSDTLRELSPGQRPCNFPEDASLRMWPLYTRNMCTLECRYNLIKKKCGCYPHFARPMPGTPTCNVTQLHCIGNNSLQIISLKLDGVNLCSCPEDCNTSHYEKVYSNEVNLGQASITLMDRPVNIDVEFPFVKLQYQIFFGFNDFLVSVGGAAGLFLGASIISFIEILYYITLRLFCYSTSIRKYRTE
ncbi:pickpocket protein 11-like isoform X2 [Athalia rosae]|uniref:pickpocket protein 11-like isoform X2 n=1 Tax=Athalia rosae TaxID=37344 RepID=UPI002034918D|nr:pickpocket protein 11-like isoform X2 [Athalia rosae]